MSAEIIFLYLIKKIKKIIIFNKDIQEKISRIFETF